MQSKVSIFLPIVDSVLIDAVSAVAGKPNDAVQVTSDVPTILVLDFRWAENTVFS